MSLRGVGETSLLVTALAVQAGGPEFTPQHPRIKQAIMVLITQHWGSRDRRLSGLPGQLT